MATLNLRDAESRTLVLVPNFSAQDAARREKQRVARIWSLRTMVREGVRHLPDGRKVIEWTRRTARELLRFDRSGAVQVLNYLDGRTKTLPVWAR